MSTQQPEHKNAEQTQMDVWRQAFGLFDKNGDGTISLSELERLMHSINLNPTKKEVQMAASHLDRDGNGKCDFEDFCKFMKERAKSPEDNEQEMKTAFRVFDQDGNDYIDKHELVYIVSRLGEPLTEAELDLAMKYLDLDGDGKINYEEFAKLCNSPVY